MRVAQALNPNAYGAAENFPEQVRDLQAWTASPSHQGIAAHPRGEHAPEVWILGSSDYGAQLAAHFGLPYAFAYFFTDGQGCEQALDLYRRLYRPSERHPQPQATICVWALCAERAEDAQHHALSREHWRMGRMRGQLGPLLDPAEVVARGFRDEDTAALQQMRVKALVGDPGEVGAKLRALAASLELDHLVVNCWSYHPQVRRDSYALLAREFGLVPRS
jgi:luciferase family oxidoreductase group 1